MNKFIDKHIEWLVAAAVVFITTLSMLRALMVSFEVTIIHRIVAYSIIPLLAILLLYQKKHYGLKFFDRFFVGFYLMYSLYILLYITVFRLYPLESMLSVPKSIALYFYELTISFCYLLCAPTIYNHFCVKKYVFLSLLVCTIPSVLFINFIGVELIQAGINADEEQFLQTISISYANVFVLVFAVMFLKKMARLRWLSYMISIAIISAVLYVLFAFGKRGPMLWAFVSVMVCYFVSSVNTKKFIAILGVLCISFILLIDPILEGIKEVMPRTGQQLELSIKEGDTANRFNMKDPKHSNFLIGLENFSRSPIWGYYFRHVTNDNSFKGAYAHNIFVEILMTMGLIGFIPFVLLLAKAFKKSRKVFRMNYKDNQMAILILFLCPFLQLQTTGTIVFKHDFWLFFYMLCCIDKLTICNKNVSKCLMERQTGQSVFPYNS